MKTIRLYKFDELGQEAHQQRAIKQYRDKNQEIFWADETLDSLRKLFETCDGVKLKDYYLGEYNSSLDVEFSQDEAGELSGPRAMAWIENNLLYKLRYKPGIAYIRQRVWRSDCVKSIDRPDGAFINHIGAMKDCPFTGYCADDDYLDSLLKDIREGTDLKTAFEGLAAVYQNIINQEIEYQNSDEYISEDLTINEYDYTVDGVRI